MNVLEQYFCFLPLSNLMARSEDLGMKLVQFIFGAELMQYMLLLRVAENLKMEIFNNCFFPLSVHAVVIS